LDLRNGNNSNISYFNAFSNLSLSCIYVDDRNAGYLSTWNIDPIANFVETQMECVTYTYVPDNNFEQALIDLGYDNILDDSVLTANISEVVQLNIQNKSISDLTGIKDFKSLVELNCSNNQLTNMDLSQDTALTILYCNANNILNINISQNTNLSYLRCDNNQLSTLDLSQNNNLSFLRCNNNQLSNLDLLQNTSLTNFWCSDNQLTSLDIRNGNNINFINFDANPNPSLTCIFVDDKNASYLSAWDTDQASHFVETQTECFSLTYIPDNNFEQALIDYSRSPILQVAYN